jgi:hypothetical protein
MGVVLIYFQAVNKPAKLAMINLADIIFSLRPPERLLLQAFVPQAESVSIPVQNFYDILPAVAECKQVPG